MVRTTAVLLAALVMSSPGEAQQRNPFSSSAPGYPKWAAFSAVRWQDDAPEVRVEDDWHELVSIAGVEAGAIVTHCRTHYGRKWKERFSEDLPVVLRLMGHEVGREVDLVLRRDGQLIEKRGLRMTKENRDAIVAARRSARKRARARRVTSLTREQVVADLEQFRTALDERFSYRHASPVDLSREIAAIAWRAGHIKTPAALSLELNLVLGRFIDGHAGVSGLGRRAGFLPFLVEPTGERLVAFLPDRTGLVDRAHPYLVALDGKPIGEWLRACEALAPNGSPQYRLRAALQRLRFLEWNREALGLETGGDLTVQLAGEDPKDVTEVTLPVSQDYPKYGRWPRPRLDAQVLDGGIGYLSLPRMNDGATEAVREWMPRFTDTKGIVVDLRGNGGGSREAMLELLPWLLEPGAKPRVVNVAAYRLHESHGHDHLTARHAYRADWPDWTTEERRAIRRFTKAFRPEWQPPPEHFSDWHYVVVSPPKDPRRTYAGRVAVLLDAKCFSATDILLGALEHWPRVTLVGSASGGGSARVQGFTLRHSGLEVRIGSMASFRPNGLLYDGRGIAPDVVVEPTPQYFLEGGRDEVLERALAILTR